MAEYVNNAELLEYLTKRRVIVQAELAAGRPKPVLDNYLGKCIIAVSTNLSYRPNFIGYSFRTEMIGDAIENLLVKLDNFDPARSKYPFAYMTQIAWNAFVRRIQKEQKEQRIKGRLIQEMPIEDLLTTGDMDEDGIPYYNHFVDYLRDNNFIGVEDKVITVNKVLEKEGLEIFFDADPELAELVEELEAE
jgi:hypothetical protein